MLWLALATLAAWIALLLFRGGFWRIGPARLPSLPSGPAPDVAVVIPARDEAGLIGRAVASLAAQQYPGALRIWVADDHSTDATAAEARASGAEVVAVPPLPEGWTGKLWAVQEALAHALTAAPRYVLLTDADIEHSPGAVASLVALAESDGCDLASLMVRLHCVSPAERLLIPAFLFFFFKLYPPRWTADPHHRDAGAAGGTMLVRASALERIGGIQAIRSELIDDCALARAIKRSGGRVWLGAAPGSRSLRPYASIWGMIARTAFTQLGYSTVLLALTVVSMALIYLAPPFLTLAADGPARAGGAAAWLLMCVAYLPTVRYYSLPAWWTVLLPAAALFYTGATVDSAVRYWRGTGGRWKGRVQAPRSRG